MHQQKVVFIFFFVRFRHCREQAMGGLCVGWIEKGNRPNRPNTEHRTDRTRASVIPYPLDLSPKNVWRCASVSTKFITSTKPKRKRGHLPRYFPRPLRCHTCSFLLLLPLLHPAHDCNEPDRARSLVHSKVARSGVCVCVHS